MRAVLALPASAAPRPAVIVIHEIFGLNDDIRRITGRVADLGWVALAPDLYDTAGPRVLCVLRAMLALRRGEGPAFADLEAARTWLAARPEADPRRTGVIGFCMGGGFALMCAPREGFSAAAVNYGVVPSDAERALAGSCPVVGTYGARDTMGVSHPERLEAALTALGVPHDVKVYPEAGHGFMDSRPAALAPLLALARLKYDKAAAEDAWQRIFAFFGQYLTDLQIRGGLGVQVVADEAAGGRRAPPAPGRS